jgi:hypothetical protein
MTIARKPRGRPFKPGNRGRPPGSTNKITRLVEQLAEGQAEQLVQKTIELAQAGDVTCLRMLLDRLWPQRRGQPVKLDTRPLKTSDDVLGAIITLWNAIAEGHLTPDEAVALSSVAERSMAVINQQEERKRIEMLEADRELRDATKNFEAT